MCGTCTRIIRQEGMLNGGPIMGIRLMPFTGLGQWEGNHIRQFIMGYGSTALICVDYRLRSQGND